MSSLFTDVSFPEKDLLLSLIFHTSTKLYFCADNTFIIDVVVWYHNAMTEQVVACIMFPL